MKIAIVSGYFDPLHIGHLDYLEQSKELADMLFVIVNNDEQAKLKKGKSFMNEDDRCRIIDSLKVVDKVWKSIDTDKTVCKSLIEILEWGYSAEYLFCNGGDGDIGAEAEVAKKYNVEVVTGLGEKIRSSRNYTGIE